MTEYPVAKREYIKRRGVFNLEELLQTGSSWFWGFRYYWTEKEHTEKIKPEGTEFLIEWRAKRKIDAYFAFNINVVILVYRYKAIEINPDTNRPIKGEGQVEITIKGDLITDYKDNFRGKYAEILKKIYERYIIKDRISTYKGKLLAEVHDLKKNLKSVLEMYS